jgi:two-component system, NarL family, invasion response regulator UvrY
VETPGGARGATARVRRRNRWICGWSPNHEALGGGAGVDDQERFRAAVGELVVATEGFHLIGEAASGEEALEAAAALDPRMVIMDKRMSGIDGIEATRLLTKRQPNVVVVLASVDDIDTEVALSAGAAAFVRKQKLSMTLLKELWRDHGP